MCLIIVSFTTVYAIMLAKIMYSGSNDCGVHVLITQVLTFFFFKCLVTLIKMTAEGMRKGFLITSGRSWNWSVIGGGGGRAIETCVALESVAVETETFSSFEVECVATWVVGEASYVEGTAYGGVGAPWESAQL